MHALTYAALFAALAFVAALAGVLSARAAALRERVTEARDAIGSVVGLLVLLVALVLGLLIWTAFGVYAGQKASLQSLASTTLQLDAALARGGPNAAAARAKLHEAANQAAEQFWPDDPGGAAEPAKATHDEIALIMRRNAERGAYLEQLSADSDTQKQALAQARQLSATLGQTRLQMALQLDDPVPLPMLGVVCGWCLLIFFGYGLLTRANSISIIALAAAALAVGSAFFLIIDLSRPYSGLIRISPDLFSHLVQDLNK